MVALGVASILNHGENFVAQNESTHFLQSKPKQPKTLEERYQKKTPLEHILHRPESYIGSVQQETQTVWVWDKNVERIVSKSITYVPGLYKIFDEILVNAADVKARERHEGRSTNAKKMTYIKVEIDTSRSCITVLNDGEAIPIDVHAQYNIYIPELIFGHLLTSDNYDDSELRVTGGRNGYGAKLTNIFSTSFKVECTDSSRERKFVKVWKNNMMESDPCRITPYKEKKDFVKVSFVPDLQRFQLSHLDEDFVSLLTKRVYDVAGCCSLKVWFNGCRLPIDSFKSYVDLYFSSPTKQLSNEPSSSVPTAPLDGEKSGVFKVHEKAARWEVIISMSDGQFQQVSFVNAIATLKGGTHVNYVTEPLIQAILRKVSTKNKGGMELKSHQIRAHLWIFLNCLIVNPTFDSQAKETLTTKPSQFGSSFVLSERTINTVMKSEVVDTILLWTKMKQQVELQKKLKGNSGRTGRDRIIGIPKLEDANDAGTKYSNDCTLILTEGESAKTSCIAGLSVVGRDRYGVFSLRGKLLNVREASFKQQVENQEIQAILKIMGLQVGKKLDSPKGLRYGSLMIMTDQDLDGSHIKGLVINMIAHYWPELLRYRSFLKEFVTPIVKVSRQNERISFFTLREYEMWKEKNQNGKGWKTRYYKGLGTSSDKEFKEYFSQLERHSLDFVYNDEEDLNSIDMAFNAKRAEHRKMWIQNYQEGDFVDHSLPVVSYKDFIYKELVQFSRYDVIRSIPNCIDGLKPVQRKVLFACFKRNLKSEIKVAQLVGYISEYTAYHHGEQSLGSTIIAMAQTFVGSNNINLLQPCGQFGSRKEGGKDASAIRYIFTRLSHITRALFPEADDPLLEYQNDDGIIVEPKYYVPIIPIALVNGVEGIGTGWSSSIPNYNPRDLIENIRLYLRGEPMNPMVPWYKGFTGRIVEKVGGFESIGNITQIDEETLQITELPVKVWTQTYKQFLEELVMNYHNNTSSQPDSSRSSTQRNGSARTPSSPFSLVDYRDNSSHEAIHFTLKVSPDTMIKLQQEGFEKTLRLRKPISTLNMTLFDPNFKVQRYSTELDIVREFAQLRYQFYELRRAYCIEKIQRECRILKNKVRFIQAILNAQLILNNRKKDDIIRDLLHLGFDTYSSILQESTLITRLERQNKGIEADAQDENESPTVITTGRDFEYLLGMSLWSLSLEKIEELKHQEALKCKELQKYQVTTPEDLWEEDLLNLEKALDEQEQIDAAQTNEHKELKSLKPHSFKNRSLAVFKNKRKPKCISTNLEESHDSNNNDSSFTTANGTSVNQNTQSKKRENTFPDHGENALLYTMNPSNSYGTSPAGTSNSTQASNDFAILEKMQLTIDSTKQSKELTEGVKKPSMSLANRVKQRKEASRSQTASSSNLNSQKTQKSLRELLGIRPKNSVESQTDINMRMADNQLSDSLPQQNESIAKSRAIRTSKFKHLDINSNESDSSNISFISLASSSSFGESSDDIKPRARSKGVVQRSSRKQKLKNESFSSKTNELRNIEANNTSRGRGKRRLRIRSPSL